MTASIIVVNTNEWHVLKACLESIIRETTEIGYEIIVVDNASTDGSREHLAGEFPAVKVIVNDRNRGFAASNNRGFAAAQGEFLLLLNPDTVVLDRAIERTIHFMEAHPEAGIVGCRLLLGDGSIQQSVRAFPTAWNVFVEATFLYRVFPRTALFGRYYMTDFQYDRTRRVDWLCGAYFMIRRSVLDRIGILDEQFFMYTEEVDYCYRAAKAGFQTWFFHDADIIHFWGGVNAANKRVILWSNGSQILFFKKHFSPLSRTLMTALKCWGLLNRVVAYGILGLLSFRRTLLAKSGSHRAALVSILGGRWTYDRDHRGEVPPWTA